MLKTSINPQATMATVSYVVTLYNKTAFLPYLVGGLLAQEGDFDKEFIFVDDGSTDGTADVLEAMLGDRTDTVIIRQANAGPSYALNRGFQAATGDYVKPVDGDDILGPAVTRLLLDALRQTGCGLAYANMSQQGLYQLGEDPQSVLASCKSGPARAEREDDTLRKCLRNAYFNPTAWLSRRDLVEQSGGCDTGVFIQDYSIVLRMARLTTFARVDAERVLLLPREAEGRLSDDGAQILHDLNMALVRFLNQNPDLAPDLVRFATGRITGRAWAWARRHGKHGSSSFQALAINLLARLGLVRPGALLDRAACAPFRETSRLRLPS